MVEVRAYETADLQAGSLLLEPTRTYSNLHGAAVRFVRPYSKAVPAVR